MLDLAPLNPAPTPVTGQPHPDAWQSLILRRCIIDNARFFKRIYLEAHESCACKTEAVCACQAMITNMNIPVIQ
jgi:hypothetical protein